MIQETYTLDPHGIVSVRIENLDTGVSQVHALSED